MAHLSGILPTRYSTICVTTVATTPTLFDSRAEGDFATIFSDRDASASSDASTAAALPWVRIPNLREFPAFGTPANVVAVPNYGQSTSSQIQGQADAPTLEVTINVDMNTLSTSGILPLIGDGNSYYFALHLLNSEPTTGAGDDRYQTLAANIGTVPNSSTYFLGRLEAITYTPALSDSFQATITLTVQSDFEGPFTL